MVMLFLSFSLTLGFLYQIAVNYHCFQFYSVTMNIELVNPELLFLDLTELISYEPLVTFSLNY